MKTSFFNFIDEIIVGHVTVNQSFISTNYSLVFYDRCRKKFVDEIFHFLSYVFGDSFTYTQIYNQQCVDF